MNVIHACAMQVHEAADDADWRSSRLTTEAFLRRQMETGRRISPIFLCLEWSATSSELIGFMLLIKDWVLTLQEMLLRLYCQKSQELLNRLSVTLSMINCKLFMNEEVLKIRSRCSS